VLGATAAVAGATEGAAAVVGAEGAAGAVGSGTAGASAALSVVTGAGAVAAGVVEAVVSILKSAAVGGGTLAGSGRGIAASIASSAGVLREGSCANAEVADIVRKVAATAINTRSNPPRLFRQSRIIAPLG
jgi:hypothetical protein